MKRRSYTPSFTQIVLDGMVPYLARRLKDGQTNQRGLLLTRKQHTPGARKKLGSELVCCGSALEGDEEKGAFK
jgi:hypothetical protein